MGKMILVYVSCKDKKEAVKISKILLQKKLIASTNYFPITSMSNWTKKIQAVKEYALIIKTNKKFSIIKKEVEKAHSYKVPCILKINFEANEKYAKWVRGEVR